MAKAGFDRTTSLRVVQATRHGNLETWGLTANLIYVPDPTDPSKTITVKRFTRTDFASVPGFLTWLVPTSGKYARAAVLHDYLCQEIHKSRKKGKKPSIERHDADGLFRQAMGSLGVPTIQRYVMWVAVRLGSLRRVPGAPPRRDDHGQAFLDWLGILGIFVAFLVCLAPIVALGIIFADKILIAPWAGIPNTSRWNCLEIPLRIVSGILWIFSPVLIGFEVILVAMWLYFAEVCLAVWMRVRRRIFGWTHGVRWPSRLRWLPRLRGEPLRTEPAFWWQPATGRPMQYIEFASVGFGLALVGWAMYWFSGYLT